MQSVSNEPKGEARRFHTTQWNLVSAASGDSDEALQSLCIAYWPPLHAYLRRLGYQEAESDDLTQAFFTRLIENRLLVTADPGRGRFRTFLITSLRRFLVNEWKFQTSAKRGGNRPTVRLALDEDAELHVIENSREITPDRLFERQWALQVLQHAFSALAAEQIETENRELFEALAPSLTFEPDAPSYNELAKQCHATPAALRMSISRLRRRLGELIRVEIRKTVSHDAQVEDELRELFRAIQS